MLKIIFPYLLIGCVLLTSNVIISDIQAKRIKYTEQLFENFCRSYIDHAMKNKDSIPSDLMKSLTGKLNRTHKAWYGRSFFPESGKISILYSMQSDILQGNKIDSLLGENLYGKAWDMDTGYLMTSNYYILKKRINDFGKIHKLSLANYLPIAEDSSGRYGVDVAEIIFMYK